MRRVKDEVAEQDRRLRLREMPIIRKKRKKKTKDVVGQGRRWAGWRGMYGDTSSLNGPVTVKKVDPSLK